ncbi:MAG: beta-N-acetylhexosaminidase [Mariniphaga sp.]
MNKFKFIFIILLLFSIMPDSVFSAEQAQSLIPAPASAKWQKGSFTLSDKTKIIVSPLNNETKLSADLLALLVKNPTGQTLVIAEGSKPFTGSVFMVLDGSIKNDEGYRLEITPKGVTIHAKTAVGLFYAVQTIRQLLPVAIEKPLVINGLKLTLPACEIADEPRFVYRGMHLDVGRHLFPVASIKRYIDMLALHKMNTFHWHLTEDQGWRIEIKKYPRLTEIGAYRKETVSGAQKKVGNTFDGKPYGGFYTQNEVREIVKYAKSKFITVIPEIEMPGHAIAALTSYPELSCTGGPFEVRKLWGVDDDVFCAGNEQVFNFLQDVLTEVMDLFPSKYIHIGGDECPKKRWEKCDKCQKRMKDEGLKNELELQSYFIRRIEKFVSSKGRNIIGWDEILEGGLAPGATVMSWRGEEGGIVAAKSGHDVVMTPGKYTYFCYYQSENHDGQPLALGGYVPLELVYGYNPTPRELTAEEQKHILGVQGCLWTEQIQTPEVLEFMAYPRTFAIAETGWTPDNMKNFENFVTRLKVLNKRYDAIGINYYNGEYRDTKALKEKK